MSGRYQKEINELSIRHKRRRTKFIRQNLEQQNAIPAVGNPDFCEQELSKKSLSLLVNANLVLTPEEQELEQDEQEEDQESEYSEVDQTDSSAEEDSDEERSKEIQFFLEENPAPNDSDNDDDPDNNDDYFDEPLEVNPDVLARQKLKHAFLEAKLTQVQCNIMLKALRQNPFGLVNLPKDARTVLGTPSFVASRIIQNTAGGEYLHIGFKYGILKKLQTIPLHMLPEFLEIDFSTDGAQLDKNLCQYWPIQHRINNILDRRPIIIGVFKGYHKPNNAYDFLNAFVEEFLEIHREGGVEIYNRKIPIKIRSFIADAPARALVLNHYGHTSAHACSKCKVEGYRCEIPGFRGAMIFIGTGHELRTDEEYRLLLDEDHHKGQSPLAALPMGLVSQSPFEGMHLIWIGVVKKVIRAHVEGDYLCPKLYGRKLVILKSRTETLSKFCPTEFGRRRPRSIQMFHHFKAVEFRQLLLYTAPALFMNVFDNDYFRHFLLLHIVMRLLVSENTSEENYTFCEQALESYVRTSEILFGSQFLTYNVHGLLHIVQDCRTLGSLETFSAFAFENSMPEFRKFIRKPYLQLQQFCKSIYILNDIACAPVDDSFIFRQSQFHFEGPLTTDLPPNCRQFKKLEIGKLTFALNLRDNCCILKDRRICLIENIVQVQANVHFIIRPFERTASLYEIGVSSESVGIYHCTRLSLELHQVLLNDVAGKCYRMPKWSSLEDHEEDFLENEWICTTILTPLSLE